MSLPRRPERLALAAAVALACALLGQGWPQLIVDERRVRGATPARLVAAGDLAGAAENLWNTSDGRPLLPVAYLPAGLASAALGGPLGVTRAPPRADVDFDLDALDLATGRALSGLFAGLAVLLAGRLGERLGGRGAGWMAAAWLGGSVAFLFHGRTTLPVALADAVGAAFLLQWLRAVREEAPGREATRAGWMGAALLLVYPGAYPLGAVGLVDLALHGRAARARLTRATLALLLGLLLAEAVVRTACGVSVCHDLVWMESTIVEGDPREGWRFAWEWLWTTDGAAGVGLLGAGLAGAALGWRRGGEARLLGGTLLVVVLLQSLVVSTLLGRQVLYGRTVGPWLVLAAPLAGALPAWLGRRVGPRLAAALVAALALHQAPRWWALARTPPADHEAALYEGRGPAARAAWRAARRS